MPLPPGVKAKDFADALGQFHEAVGVLIPSSSQSRPTFGCRGAFPASYDPSIESPKSGATVRARELRSDPQRRWRLLLDAGKRCR